MARKPTLRTALPGFLGILKHLSPWIRRERPLITSSMGVLILGVLLRLAEPWPLKFVLDRVIPTKRPKNLNSLPLIDDLEPTTLLVLCCLAVIAFTGLRALADYWQKVGLSKVGIRILRDVRTHVFLHLQALSVAFHKKARGGDLIVRVTRDISLLRDVMSTALIPLIASCLTLVGMLGIMLAMQWQLTLLALAVAPLFWLSTIRIGRGIHQAARKQRQREGDMAASAAESIAAIEVVQALSLEDSFAGDFASRNAKSQKEEMKAAKLTAGLGRTVDLLLALATALVLGFGGNMVLNGAMSPGDIVIFLTYLKRAFRPAKDLAKYTARLAKATAAGERVVELLEITPEVRDAPDARPTPPLEGTIRFEDVHFGYEAGHAVLDGVDVEIPARSMVAIVGDSGGGKSTMVNLLPRLFDPTGGRVLVDGHDLRTLTLASLRAQIGSVLQQAVLFTGTIRENISVGLPEATLEAVQEAAQKASAHAFIERLPDGYETLVGERGATLSQGQRQRIALARALIRPTPILILDEPTAGLDEENERQVTEALRNLARDRTTLLVTHDLRSAAAADEVILLEKGRVAERGAPDALLAGQGTFARLFRMQTLQGPTHGS